MPQDMAKAFVRDWTDPPSALRPILEKWAHRLDERCVKPPPPVQQQETFGFRGNNGTDLFLMSLILSYSITLCPLSTATQVH